MSSFRKAHPRAGARPGTLVIPADSPAPRIFITEYSATEVREQEIAGPADIPPDPPSGTVRWIDVRGFGDEAVIRAIGDRFGMTPLAIEDAVNAPQRPKSELYPKHHLVISRVPMPAGDDLTVPQVCLVFTERVLLTFQEQPFGIFDPVRERIREGIGPIRHSGADYLAYALIDTMVDRYYPIAEGLSNALDEIEDGLLEDREEAILAELRRVRRELVMVRRIAWPQRDMVAALQREPSDHLAPATRDYLRDTFDHIAQMAELLDASRDTATALANELLSMIGQRTNDIMKVLTLMASLFIPLTFVAGIYGMNFENMPELHSRNGYFMVLGAMGVMAAGMLYYFRRRGWLGR